MAVLRVLPLVVACSLFGAPVNAAPAPVISWVSAPLRPNQTAIVVGGGFDVSCGVTLTSFSNGSSVDVAAVENHTTTSTLKFTVPDDVPHDAWNVTVSCASGTSEAFAINQPEPWWIQGDAGATATQGGWVRILGMSLSNVPARVAEIRQQLRDLRERVTEQRAATDDPAGDDSLLGAASEQIVSLRAELAGLPQTQTSLLLTPVTGGAPVTLVAAPANASAFSAYFAIPASLAAGDYAVSISSGVGGWVSLDSFVSAAAPHTSTLTVTAPLVWPPGVWVVSQVRQEYYHVLSSIRVCSGLTAAPPTPSRLPRRHPSRRSCLALPRVTTRSMRPWPLRLQRAAAPSR